MKIDELSDEEKQLIEAHRKVKDENSPKKMAFLSKDLYSYSSGRGCDLVFIKRNNFWLCDYKTKEQWIEDFKNHFVLRLPIGTKFVCYMEDGEESWYDDVGYGIEGMSRDWADKYLIGFTSYKE
jgi:hypothetical protein